MNRCTVVAITVISFALPLLAIGPKPPIVDGIPLQFMLPDSYDTLDLPPKATFPKKLYFMQIVDTRDTSAIVGKLIKNGQSRAITTNDTVAVWTLRYLCSLLHHYGIAITTDSLAADGIVAIGLQDFTVIKSQEYQGSITMSITVLDRQGVQLFSKKIHSEASRWGKRWKLKRYHQCISETLQNFSEALARDEDLIKVVQ
jgi:hypothetical protein